MIILWIGCADRPPSDDAGAPTPEEVITRAVRAHGMEGLDRFAASFTFRDRTYGIETEAGRYRYTRDFTDTLGKHVTDELTNVSLRRSVDGTTVLLSQKDSFAFAESVNSVRYFFMLPYGLYDPSVNTELLPAATIGGQDYHRIRVTFDEEGGGTDFDDVYHYFFNQATGELDYLAYSFSADDGGIRFREAINKRRINGVLVQDYINYGVNGDERDLTDIDRRFATGELPELSRIINEGVRIDRVGGR